MNGLSGFSARRAMRDDQIVVDHLPKHLVRQQCQFVDLVRGAEAIEEMDEGHPRLERCRLRDQRHVVRFLDGAGRPAARIPVERTPSRPMIAEIDSAWAASERAATWKTAQVSSPAILYILGIINMSPCDAVKVVVSAPA
jgi:hypothetical protein